jgi:hypothetical protein
MSADFLLQYFYFVQKEKFCNKVVISLISNRSKIIVIIRKNGFACLRASIAQAGTENTKKKKRRRVCLQMPLMCGSAFYSSGGATSW